MEPQSCLRTVFAWGLSLWTWTKVVPYPRYRFNAPTLQRLLPGQTRCVGDDGIFLQGPPTSLSFSEGIFLPPHGSSADRMASVILTSSVSSHASGKIRGAFRDYVRN